VSTPPAPIDYSAEAEAVIRARVTAWNAIARSRDVDGFLSMYADDVLLLFEGLPDVRGAEAMREPVTTHGGYVVVWRKGSDGVWRCAVDAPVSDPPLEEAPR
jgi:ketosteroid isomerase-like protein